MNFGNEKMPIKEWDKHFKSLNIFELSVVLLKVKDSKPNPKLLNIIKTYMYRSLEKDQGVIR